MDIDRVGGLARRRTGMRRALACAFALTLCAARAQPSDHHPDLVLDLEREQSRQRLDLRQRQVTPDPLRGADTPSQRSQRAQSHAVERMRQDALQSEQRSRLGLERGRTQDPATARARERGLRDSFAEQQREQTLRRLFDESSRVPPSERARQVPREPFL